MRRIDVKKKLDEIKKSFHPSGMHDTYNLEEKEYELLINTVWQYSEGLDEEVKIHPKECIEMLQGNNSYDIFISKILLRLLKDCGLFNFYKKSL